MLESVHCWRCTQIYLRADTGSLDMLEFLGQKIILCTKLVPDKWKEIFPGEWEVTVLLLWRKPHHCSWLLHILFVWNLYRCFISIEAKQILQQLTLLFYVNLDFHDFYWIREIRHFSRSPFETVWHFLALSLGL